MSRRRAFSEPWPGVSDEDLLMVLFGCRRYQDRPMRGCRERCCSPEHGIEYRLPLARLEWQLSGMELVSILAMVTGWMAVLAAVARGGGLW